MDKTQEFGGGEVHEVYQDKVENGDHRENNASYHSPQKLDVRSFELRTLRRQDRIDLLTEIHQLHHQYRIRRNPPGLLGSSLRLIPGRFDQWRPGMQ